MVATTLRHAPDNLSDSGESLGEESGVSVAIGRLWEDVEQEKVETALYGVRELTEKLDNVTSIMVRLTCIVQHLQREHVEQNKINKYLVQQSIYRSRVVAGIGLGVGIFASALFFIEKH